MKTDIQRPDPKHPDGDLIVKSKLGVGTTTPTSQIYVVDTLGDSARGIQVAEHYEGSGAAILQFKKSRGTEAAPLALQNNDNAGAIHANAYDSAAYQLTASIIFKVDGAVSSGSIPTDILFYTGSSAATRTEKMRLLSSGNFGIGTTAPKAPLDVAGGIRMGNDSRPCTTDLAGLMRFNNGNLELCDGSAWKTTGGIQSFACVPAMTGAVRYSDGQTQYCNGSGWTCLTYCGGGGE
jgi:hypothetical protein